MLLPFVDTAFQRVMATLRPSRIFVDHGFDDRPGAVQEQTRVLTNCARPPRFCPGSPRTSDSRLAARHLVRRARGEAPVLGSWSGFWLSGIISSADMFVGVNAGVIAEMWGFGHFGVPTSPPWAGPVVDAAIAEGERRNKILRTGNSLPAHLYSEDSSPIPAWWWPMNIEHLHREAMDEELYLKYKFRLQFPFRPQIHVDRATQSVEFLHERMLLNARLAASYAIFFLRTRLKEGITSSAAALAGALAAARTADAAAAAAAALEHTQSLLDDEFLAAWLARPVADIALWGTAHDPRDVPLPPVNTGGWANTGGWGNGGGWGTGWGDWPPVVRKRRRMPRPYGYRRMGVIFRPREWSVADTDCGSVFVAG
ncbi:hypothetical protein B0H14DRAFT_2640707 [Mycena olivaceomarginata]|nr:hypothetical protein B0H14DRAFT_2640707 [Mycena olivaceomarginata]